MRIMNRDKKYFTKGTDTVLQRLNSNKCDEALELRNKFDKVCSNLVPRSHFVLHWLWEVWVQDYVCSPQK